MDAKKLEEEAAKLAERSRAAQDRAERTEKEAFNVRSGLSDVQDEAKSKRQAAERFGIPPALNISSFYLL